MRIAVVGCVHGKLNLAYSQITQLAHPPDFVIVCGDFQSFRDRSDLRTMSAPEKYREMGDFHEYHSGQRRAPWLTLVIGGNHEASNVLTSLPDGGWLAPRIWYMGHTGLVRVRDLVVGGLSGIYNKEDYNLKRDEAARFAADLQGTASSHALFSSYHVRREDMTRLARIKPGAVDVMVSHDWPQGIAQHGNLSWLLRRKRHFRRDVETGKLGNPATGALLPRLKPQWWLAAHLHVGYRAKWGRTRFQALDKVLPGRHFLEVIDVAPKTIKSLEHGKSTGDDGKVKVDEDKSRKRGKNNTVSKYWDETSIESDSVYGDYVVTDLTEEL